MIDLQVEDKIEIDNEVRKIIISTIEDNKENLNENDELFICVNEEGRKKYYLVEKKKNIFKVITKLDEKYVF
ncbi:hypothetical protein FDN13_07050 [Caloramator sp. E03]|uniref:hypothetical protein n=1 Tax=Caloramator sp. E03 TaxID=2576307 RepID=UPI001110928C|nr:hypothetical protein [Caloramator sp. E03]QCX33490.1 hypothetical protein FDN13_07050 [Caloramator sp. E03]